MTTACTSSTEAGASAISDGAGAAAHRRHHPAHWPGRPLRLGGGAGLFAAPFVFWQSVAAGAGFCLLWGFLVYCLWARACSFAAVLGERTVTVYSGVALPVRQVLPRRAVTSVRLLRTPCCGWAASRCSSWQPRARSSFCPPSRPSRPGFWPIFWRRMHHDPTTALPSPRRPPLPAQGGRRLPAAAGERLLEFSLNALLTALRQDAALLLFLCGASSILLEASSWALDETGVLRLRWAFISKRERIIRGEALAALTIERPLFFSAARGQPGWCSTRWASLPSEPSPFICTKKTRRSLLTA